MRALQEKALFFDDLASVYPPPKDDQDSKADRANEPRILGLILLIRLNAQVDLIAVIYKLAMRLSCTRDSCLTV